MPRSLLLCLALLIPTSLWADGPGDNLPDKVRPIPPKGIDLTQEEETDLSNGVRQLGEHIESLRKTLPPARRALLPDVEIFHRAVSTALTQKEIYSKAEIDLARKLLQEGQKRAGEIKAGSIPWPTATGFVVRGFRSRLDGTVQPYGLVVPGSYRPDLGRSHRLDVWLHGRGEKLTELAFLGERMRTGGQFMPLNAFVLHPYGRYSNAFKFAGEIDVLEALAHVQQQYRIDEDRVVMRGFSMGGAGCWQFAVHYPDRWVAAAPGAGFSETPEFLRSFQKEKLAPADHEKTLWRLYDCPGYAVNLFNLPTVAYSGENDIQKQAADIMSEALDRKGISLVHLIGPKTGHSYHPVTRDEINRRIDRIAAKGRDRVPEEVKFATYTLRYNRSYWLTLDRLGKHWEEATVTATLRPKQHAAAVETRNVEAFTLALGSGDCPLRISGTPNVVIDGQVVVAARVQSDRSWVSHFRKQEGKWQRVASAVAEGKQHGLQGPIDDAFMDSFLMVRPTGKPAHEKVGAWVNSEMERAQREWRRHFRGEVRIKDDTALTREDIAEHHLVLWGDPASNKVLASLSDKLPITWTTNAVEVGKENYPATDHTLILIAPNPLNPKRYVVLNSSFTFREYAYLNNARQVPMLPDYAVVEVRTPPSTRWPGKIARAGFFGETWKLP